MSGAVENLSRKLSAQASIWSGVENGCLAIISFVSLVVYSRLLAPEDFGAFSMAFATTELIALIVTMLFHDALIQRKDVDDAHFDTAFSFDVALAIILSLSSIALAPFFERMTASHEAGLVFAYVSLTYPFLASTAAIVAHQRRHLFFRVLAVRSMAGRGAGALIGVLAAFAGLGIKSLILQQFVTVGVGSAILWSTCDRRPRCHFSLQALMDLLVFGAYSLAALLLSFSVKRLFLLLSGITLGAVQAGYMNLGFRVTDMLWAVLATAATQPSLSVFSRVRHQHDAMRDAYVQSVRFASLFLLPCFAGIALTAREIVGVCFGTKWQPASPSLVLLAILAASQIAKLYFGPIVSALGYPQATLYAFAGQLAIVVGSLTLLHPGNLVSVLLVWVSSELLQLPVSFFLLRKLAGFTLKDQVGGMKTPVLASLVMTVVVTLTRAVLFEAYISDFWRLLCLTFVGASSYLFAVQLIDRSLIRQVGEHLGIAFGRITRADHAEQQAS